VRFSEREGQCESRAEAGGATAADERDGPGLKGKLEMRQLLQLAAQSCTGSNRRQMNGTRGLGSQTDMREGVLVVLMLVGATMQGRYWAA
jgi:hypothetical protein